MSPVSRGRGKKNRSSSGPKGRRAPVRSLPLSGDVDPDAGRPATAFGPVTRPERRDPQRSAVDALAAIVRALPGTSQVMAAARAWWPDSHAEVLEAAPALLVCTTPAQLEDAVCDLIGRHWRRQLETQDAGLAEQEWLEGLLHAARGRAQAPAVRRLLYGIAVIATPGLAGLALDVLSETTADGQEPAWLEIPPTVTASPDVLLLRDSYGLRFGVLAQVTGPGGQVRTYLYDVDLCHGFDEVLTSGYHPDIDSATAAWRDLVGISAANTQPVPADDDLLPHVLPTGGLLDGLFGQPLTDNHFTELFRGDRIVFAITDALEAAGRPLARQTGDAQQAGRLATELAERFRAWATTAGVDLPRATGPDDDVVTWVLHDWVSPGMSEELALAASPHRIAGFVAYLLDDWLPEDRPRALAVLQPWARYCLELSGITGEAAEHTLAWAGRAAGEPAPVGGDLGNHLNRPIDETTVTGPALPAYAR